MRQWTKNSPPTLRLMENLMRLQLNLNQRKPPPRTRQVFFRLMRRNKESRKTCKNKLLLHRRTQRLLRLIPLARIQNKSLTMKSKETGLSTILSSANVTSRNTPPNLRPRVRVRPFKLRLSPTKMSRSTSLVELKISRRSLPTWKTKSAICKALTYSESKSTSVPANKDSVLMLNWRNVSLSAL